jgi:heme exporter protein C
MLRLANPNRFMQWSGQILPWCATLTVLLLGAGLYLALFVAPPDYQQGESVRIMYVHVPSAYMATTIYGLMAAASAVALIWRHPVADIAAREAAPLGAGFTLLCLISGSLWGKPMWGAYWVWDARLTSVLILFFLYLGHVALIRAFDNKAHGYRAAAILALAGAVNLPIIVYSVQWWNTLHQGNTISVSGGAKIYITMLYPLLISTLGFYLAFITMVVARVCAAICERKLSAALLAKAEAS